MDHRRAWALPAPWPCQVTLDGLTHQVHQDWRQPVCRNRRFGAKALDPEFQLQFVDKTLPLADGDVEAISGATITTKAVLEA